jgi:hypothetical protein
MSDVVENQASHPVAISFWNRSNPRQAIYDELANLLVPGIGNAETIEGECLRAFQWIQHDAFNNGGGNNHSGALIFLRDHMPGFKKEWWDNLREYIVGGYATHNIQMTIHEIGENLLDHLILKDGNYTENSDELDLWNFRAEYLGQDGPEEAPRRSSRIDDEEDDWDVRYGR